jgi:hypothetical protein
MSQFEQENDLGGGGGEVDDETMDAAWDNAAGRQSTADDAYDTADDALDADDDAALQPDDSPDGAEAAA